MARARNHPNGADPPPPEDPPPPPRPVDLLNNRRRATRDAIFEKPTRSDLAWRDVERLFVALGGVVTDGAGSRRRLALNGVRAVFHEPHPERVTDKGAVDSAREFLENAGFVP
jgi:HicA toxin of bacterial toxin-antitoxin,